MDSTSRIYIQEIINFLDCVVIKYTPFETILNTKAEYYYVDGFIEGQLKTYPYYRILAGDAAFASTDIYAYSPKLKAEIILTRANVLLYPDIVTFYKEANNIRKLLSRYPEDQFLIRRILNPVKNIDAAIAAKNLTILETEYEESFLNEYERDSLMIFLQTMLWRIDYRWYMSPLEFDDIYPQTFWCMLWSVLPLLLLTKRILNIKTFDVHPFHIWEYLTSLGFGKYKGYLTRDQELFLYRNSLYLKFHAGKNFLLDILEGAFLNPLRYSLTKKTVIAHTVNREETHDKLPDVVPSSGSVDEYLSSTTFENFLKNIFTEGHDLRDDPDYLNDVTDQFKNAPTNKLATKFLELDRNIDTSEMMLLLKFILDSTVYLSTQNKLSFMVNVQSPISQNILQFDNPIDALNLLFYCLYMREETPINTFSYYTSTSAILHISEPDVNKYVAICGPEYFIRSYVDVDEIVPKIPYVEEALYSAKELSEILGIHYVWVFGMINKLNAISDLTEYEAHIDIFRTLIPEKRVLTVEQNYSTYVEFFQHYPSALTELQKITEDSQFGEFVFSVIAGICPLEYGFAALARDDKVISVLIKKIKELFMYLVSYNIAFINQTFEQSLYLSLPKLTMRINTGVAGEQDPGSDNPPYTTFIGSAMTFDLSDSFNYTISMVEETNNQIDLTYHNEFDCEIIETSILIDTQSELDLPDLITNEHDTTIIINGSGIELTFLNHLYEE